MNLTALQEYVESMNDINDILGAPRVSLLRAEDRRRIANRLEADLSPEVLTCDGELSASESQARYRFLCRVVMELQSIDPSIEIEE
jgi:hypothetical protein